MTNIKYFGFARESGSAPILGLSLQPADDEDIKIEVSRVLSNLRMLGMRVEERQKIKSAQGCWHCKKDGKGVLYLALCSANYPERHIYAAINQLRDHLIKLGDYDSQPDSTLKLHARDFLQDLCSNYENLKSIDKLSAINGLIQEVSSDTRKNTEKLVENIVDVDNLSRKSDALRENALLFESSANDLQQAMFRRNCRIKVIMVVAIVSLLLLIIVPIATKTAH